MKATVTVLLIGLWFAVLMPGLVRARREVSPSASISRFNRSMDLLERTGQPPGTETTMPAHRPHGAGRSMTVPLPLTRLMEDLRTWFAPGSTALRPAPSTGLRPRPPRRPARAVTRRSPAARRRMVLYVLAGMTAAGLALMPVHLVSGLVLGGLGLAATAAYIALLWQLQRTRLLRRRIRHFELAAAANPAGTAPGEPVPPHAEAVGEHR